MPERLRASPDVVVPAIVGEEIAPYRRRLGGPGEQTSTREDREMELLQGPLLSVPVDVHERVPADDHVATPDRRIAEQVVHAEPHRAAERLPHDPAVPLG